MDELIGLLLRDVATTQRKAVALVKKARKAVLRSAKRRCPVDTGALQREIHEEGTAIVSSLDYSRAVHDGTSRMAPRPFIRDAIEDGVAEIREGLK
jgi:HK97 gp10 family phage protein